MADPHHRACATAEIAAPPLVGPRRAAHRVVRDLHGALTIRLTGPGGRTWAEVAGEVDHTSADVLELALCDHLRGPGDTVEADLRRVAFFDCAGLNALLRAGLLACGRNATLTLVAPSPSVRRVLDLAGAGTRFGLAPSEGARIR